MHLVCVICKKVDHGNGIWAFPDRQLIWVKEDSLCPECSQERFSQIYGETNRLAKRRSLTVNQYFWTIIATITGLVTIAAFRPFSHPWSTTLLIIVVVTAVGLICLAVKAIMMVDDDCNIDRADRTQTLLNVNVETSRQNG